MTASRFTPSFRLEIAAHRLCGALERHGFCSVEDGRKIKPEIEIMIVEEWEQRTATGDWPEDVDPIIITLWNRPGYFLCEAARRAGCAFEPESSVMRNGAFQARYECLIDAEGVTWIARGVKERL